MGRIDSKILYPVFKRLSKGKGTSERKRNDAPCRQHRKRAGAAPLTSDKITLKTEVTFWVIEEHFVMRKSQSLKEADPFISTFIRL